ncbi:Hypothetical predicted protein [Olea europaea subsp. europaea]|uniref:Uncharacterized protein n=1 Tax=Olea europaea subsp. europaea TaxID=158383 RepID=A0A8S0QIG5_OLEEU|nr:Hypothetical predicted protein [Olea europaea subsp. europaea]
MTIPISRKLSLNPQLNLILCLPRSKKFQQQQVNDLQNLVHKFNGSDVSDSNIDTYGKEMINLDKRSNLGDNNGESGGVIESETESTRKILVNGLFTFGDDGEEYTRLEMEMSRKMKGRMEKEKMAKGSIKVMQESSEPISVPFERPLLDKEVGNIKIKADGLNNELAVM